MTHQVNTKRSIFTAILLITLSVSTSDIQASLILTADTEVSIPTLTEDPSPVVDSMSAGSNSSIFVRPDGARANSFGSINDDGNVQFGLSLSSGNTASASSSFGFSQVVENNSGIDQDFTFDLFIPGGFLNIGGNGGGVIGPFSEATVGYSVSLLLNQTAIFTSDLTINASTDTLGSATITSVGGNPIGGTLNSNVVQMFLFDVSFSINPFDATFDLGTFADGESFTIDYLLEAHVSGTIVPDSSIELSPCRFGIDLEVCNLGTVVSIGDPSGPSGVPASVLLSSTPTQVPQNVPEPGSLSLVALAVTGLGALRRRRS